jgi:large subunit ribosomal protein L1
VVRGSISLPHGTGKTIKILVICKSELEKSAKEAGADYVGGLDLIEKINGGWFDYDRIICTPDMMKDLARVGKVLGPKGLMPSPKTGSVTPNVASAIKEAKAGKIDFKTDKQGGIHVPAGKISFKEEQIVENATRIIETVGSSKPSSVKGIFIKSAYICSTMSPGMKII